MIWLVLSFAIRGYQLAGSIVYDPREQEEVNISTRSRHTHTGEPNFKSREVCGRGLIERSHFEAVCVNRSKDRL